MDKTLFKSYLCFVADIMLITASFVIFPLMISAKDDVLAVSGFFFLLCVPFVVYLVTKKGLHLYCDYIKERNP